MNGQLFDAAWAAGITVALVFVAIVGIGFWMLARRRKLQPAPDALGALQWTFAL